jgi:acetoin utilization deacetylase AcuC-like enzyme
MNIPLPPGTGDEGYFDAWSRVERAVRDFEPELLLVSAGFDAHYEDPLAGMEVTVDGFAELARRASTLAPRVAAVLEGGYNLRTLPDLVGAALGGFNSP